MTLFADLSILVGYPGQGAQACIPLSTTLCLLDKGGVSLLRDLRVPVTTHRFLLVLGTIPQVLAAACSQVVAMGRVVALAALAEVTLSNTYEEDWLNDFDDCMNTNNDMY